MLTYIQTHIHELSLTPYNVNTGAFSLLPITDSYQQQVSAASPEHKKSPTNHHTQQENAFLQSDAYDTEPHARTGAHVRAQSRSDSIDFDNDTSLNPDTSLNNHAFTRYMKRVNSKANMKKVQSSDV